MSLMPYEPPAPAPRKKNFGSVLGDIAFALLTGGPSPGKRREILAEQMEQQKQGFLQRAMAEAQAKSMFPDPVKPPEATSTQRTYEYLKSLGKGDLAEQFLTNAAAGPPMAVDTVDPAGNTLRQYLRPGQLGTAAPAPSGPQPGAIINGQRFKGGDYRDRNNWEPMGGASPRGGATFR